MLTPPAVAQDATSLPEIRVIGITPLSSVSTPRRPVRPNGNPSVPAPSITPVEPSDPALIDRDKVPSMVQSATATDFSRSYSSNVTETLFQRLVGVTLSDPNGNSALQEIRYRGFAASPLQGTPQGLAVYMGGIRLNEAFGDTVNWDLIPTNAITRADILTNNPVFGLNALGGAVNIQMKNGFTYQGFEADALGGSFGRRNVSVQFGSQHGAFAVYVAAQGLDENGWRRKSPTDLGRFYGDIGWRNEATELHLVTSAASTGVGAAAATPIQLLARDWKSVYTTPQTTQNDMGLVTLNAKHALSESWSVQGNIYVRGFQQSHVDGNAADIERCSGTAGNPLFNTLCLQNDAFPVPRPPAATFQILDPFNQPIPCPPGGTACALVPYGTVDRTRTDAITFGGSLQAANNDELFGHKNNFIVGGSIDHGDVTFGASSSLGYIFPDLTVGPNPAIPGTGSIIHTAGNLGFSPVNLSARNTYYGLYVTDTFEISSRLAATAGARLNVAEIRLTDVLGNSPELNSSPTYTRVNPVTGLTYRLLPGVSVYGGYSESNRAPTPLELGCSNSLKPCLLENFLVSDPPLKQVVGHTYEAGLRGEMAAATGRIEWKLGLFRTDSTDDIIGLSSAIQGRGFFTNVDRTRRQGVEASAEYRSKDWALYASYSFIDATYRFTADIASPNNPFSDANGKVNVVPGDRIPGIPQHQFKAGADYLVTALWRIGGDVAMVGSQFLVGDEANQNVKLPAYWVANLRTSYQIRKDLQIFGLVNNVFNRKYAAYGTYFDPQGVQNAGLPIALTDRRAEVPGQPLSIYVGLRAKL
jgi:iron complex outermembrane receptor protein